MENIQEIRTKIKMLLDGFLVEWGLLLIILIATLGSFALGRLSALEAARPLVQISEASLTAQPTSLVAGGMLVASRTGSTYYYPWCAGATKILPINQRIFASEAAARAAGLHAAKNCKGLE